jgi:chemotaxis protein methyltransferase CheR
MSVIGADDYVDFCEGLRQICGVDLSQYKRPQMERRLRSFFSRRGISRLSDSLTTLRSDQEELDALLDRVTINVSQLFRHPEQWRRLESDVWPELASSGQIRIWSAGSSYGAEAFTAAASARTTVPRARIKVIGTDIDRRMIERARKGTFSDDDARGVPVAQMEHGFVKVPGGWQATPELMRLVSFEFGDLLRLRPPAAGYDLVMCRNTVIYFAEPIRDELHARLAQSLRPGGYLLVGATERVSDPKSIGLEMAFPFIYRRV